MNNKAGSVAGCSMSLGGEVEEKNYALLACAQELIKAVKENDVEGVAKAMQNAFECMDAMPHVEGPHVGEY